MHDPIREHARTLASRMDPGDDRQQATARLLDYYQHAAALADALLTRHARSASPAGTTPAAVPVLASREQALAWARAERTATTGWRMSAAPRSTCCAVISARPQDGSS